MRFLKALQQSYNIHLLSQKTQRQRRTLFCARLHHAGLSYNYLKPITISPKLVPASISAFAPAKVLS